MSIKTNNLLYQAIERIRVLEHECMELGLEIKLLKMRVDDEPLFSGDSTAIGPPPVIDVLPAPRRRGRPPGAKNRVSS